SLETYDAIGPHVLIAKKMLEKGIPVRAGSLIEYIIAESQGKKGPIRDKAKLPEEMQDKEYDSDYYIRHQILPAVENIFSVFGISEDEILLSEQKKLGSFW
ncbi:MAG: DNA polymerase domain-containing protein, partial [Nanoarchaeota archaeon]